jgi:hypothetical protein
MYSEYFGGMLQALRPPSNSPTCAPLKTITPSVDSEQTISAPDGNVVLVVHLAALLRRDGDSWRFVDARPYTFATMPG